MSPILPLSEIPTLTLLYKIKHLAPSNSTPLFQASRTFNDIVSLVKTDITTLKVSAIVNAANSSLLGGGGVDGAIHAKAGPGLFDECETLDGCETGSAKITSGYELPCEKIIHAVGPVYWKAKKKRDGLQTELLASCYRKSLELAVENDCKSIAFSCLSTGVYGYPSDEAAQVAIKEVRDWLEEKSPKEPKIMDRVIFCCFENKDMKAYEEWLP